MDLQKIQIHQNICKIHEKSFIHCDFHDGNILNHNENTIYISDLKLCRPVKSFLKKYGIYGVIPFMAPEVLRGKSYTQASDIYSFSMIMWEFTSGIPPFNNRAHDLHLSLNICKGERPEIIENTPQCYVDLMKKCWNEDPLKRPSSSKVKKVIENWIFYPSSYEINEELKNNIMEFVNAPIGHNNLATKSHPKACFTSRLLDFTSKKLNEILESENSQASVNEMPVSEDLNDYVIRDSRLLDESTSKKLNEIPERLHASSPVESINTWIKVIFLILIFLCTCELGDVIERRQIAENKKYQLVLWKAAIPCVPTQISTAAFMFTSINQKLEEYLPPAILELQKYEICQCVFYNAAKVTQEVIDEFDKYNLLSGQYLEDISDAHQITAACMIFNINKDQISSIQIPLRLIPSQWYYRDKDPSKEQFLVASKFENKITPLILQHNVPFLTAICKTSQEFITRHEQLNLQTYNNMNYLKDVDE
ncbi:kinase-like protein [Rhizophagus irregularis]|uniref:Kinase-like protein n=1 Tax=Rhizophagus irregularis TaxID=588596 RepID=A0A2N1MCU6_9GLOM|nr:kinase-like protein [Rhizophagus irregularis]